jgi:hypothetical protein
MRTFSTSAVGLLAALSLAAPAAAAPPGTPGAAGIGDKLYPTLGNGGYDVLHYDVDLRYATSDPAQAIDGTVTIVARATQSLSRFDLDFAGDSVGSVSVDGKAAEWRRDGEELVITPRHVLRAGRTFVAQVRHFTAAPGVPDPDDLLGTPFIETPDGTATAGQPDSTHDSSRRTTTRATRRASPSASTSRRARRRSATASSWRSGRRGGGRTASTSSASRWPRS